MASGKHDPIEILKGTKKGIYAKTFGGGQIDITNGKFVFSASEAYMIEDGKISYPIKGATLIGSGFEVLKKVQFVGNDLEMDLYWHLWKKWSRSSSWRRTAYFKNKRINCWRNLN